MTTITNYHDELKRQMVTLGMTTQCKTDWLNEHGIVSSDTHRRLRYVYTLSDGRVVSAESALKITNPSAFATLKARHRNFVDDCARADIFLALPVSVQTQLIVDIPIDEIVATKAWRHNPYLAVQGYLMKQGSLLAGSAASKTGAMSKILARGYAIERGNRAFDTPENALTEWVSANNKTATRPLVMQKGGKFVAVLKNSVAEETLIHYGWEKS